MILRNGERRRSSLPGPVGRFLRNPLGLVPAVLMLLVILSAVLVPFLGLPDPGAVALREALLPPSVEHLLGTDASGRDILSRLFWGGQVNLLGAVLAVSVALLVGLPSGLIAGYYGGWFDSVANWANNMNMALPGIVVVLAVRSVVGPSVWMAMAVFGVMLAPGVFRLVRAAVQTVRGELYVDAARVSGLSDARIISRHVFAVVRAPIVIQAARMASIAIAIQAGLEFLGVSDNTVPSWGNMLNEGFRRLGTSPQLVLWPSIIIGIVCTALVLIGNALRDALEDRGRAASTGTGSSTEESTASLSVAGLERIVAATADAEQGPKLLSVRDLQVAYGRADDPTVVVYGVDLSVAPGEVLGLVGESGSGKTQTAFSILGLLPDGGRVAGGAISFDGRNLTALSKKDYAGIRGKDIAYIPQEPMSNLDPSFRIGYQLITPLRAVLGLSKQEATARSLELLERVGIPDPQKTFRSYPHEISGGMAQRVLIAGAVSCRPRLLIADEPTTALDVTVQAEVLDLLRDLQKEEGMAMILVTHNFGVVADICDRVAVMQRGRIVETSDVVSIMKNPQHPYTRRLLASTLEGGPARPYPFGDAADQQEELVQ